MNNKAVYTVYIDESGDLGIKRGLRWFVITATIVKKEDEPEIRATLRSLRNKYNLQQIHLKDIRNIYKIADIVKTVAKHDFTTVSVIIDTDMWNLKDGIKSYNYSCRILLERVSWFLRDKNAYADVVLSSRGTSRDKELENYIKELHLIPNSNIDNRFIDIKSKTPSEWDLLQLADVTASSTAKAHQINEFGFVTPCFLNILNEKIYRYNGHTINYGIKYIDSTMKPSKEYFYEHMICKK